LFGIRKLIVGITVFTPVEVIPETVLDAIDVHVGLASVPTVPLSDVVLYHRVDVVLLCAVVVQLPMEVRRIPPPLLFSITKVMKLPALFVPV
jgi:hypothetical protein